MMSHDVQRLMVFLYNVSWHLIVSHTVSQNCVSLFIMSLNYTLPHLYSTSCISLYHGLPSFYTTFYHTLYHLVRWYRMRYRMMVDVRHHETSWGAINYMAHHGVTPQYIMRHHGNFCDILKHHKVILRLNTALIKVLKLCKVAEQLKFISKQCNCHKIGSHNGRFWGRFGTIYNLSDIIVYRAITRVMSCVVYL